MRPIFLPSARIAEAVALATSLHGEQTRKATDIPYLSHLLGVAGLVMEHGGDEEQTIAGLLHDAVEDAGAHAEVRISVNVTAHFANNVTGGFTRLRGV